MSQSGVKIFNAVGPRPPFKIYTLPVWPRQLGVNDMIEGEYYSSFTLIANLENHLSF
jgi:hypothetical protein